MSLQRPHVSRILRWSADSDIETLAAVARKRLEKASGGIAFAQERERPKKEAVRQRLLDRLTPQMWPEQLSIVTMPGANWSFETRLLENRNYDVGLSQRSLENTFITAIENDPVVYAAGLLNVPGGFNRGEVRFHPRSAWDYATFTSQTFWVQRYFCCDVLDFCRYKERLYDVAWLDMTGPISSDLLRVLPRFWNECVGTYLVVTALNARWANDIGRRLERAGGPFQLLRSVLDGAEYESVNDQITYCDTVSMITAILRRPDQRRSMNSREAANDYKTKCDSRRAAR